jgi:hypothetical protein
VDAEPNSSAYDELLRLSVPTSRVAADTVEGEAVIINLDTGEYYTTQGVGCDAWQLLALGRTVGEVVSVLGDRYAAADGAIEGYLQLLIKTFLAEGLMVVLDAGDPPPVDDGIDELPAVETRLPFEPADFVSYRDMKGLLLLDPVHEVDAKGWPHAAAGG